MSDQISQQQYITNKARSDKFQLVFTLPAVLRDLDTQLLEVRNPNFIQGDSVQYSIWGTVVPQSSVPAQELRHYGQSVQVSSQSRPAYQPISVSFTIDNYFNNYWVLWKWLDKMNKVRESGMDEHFNYDNIHDAKSNLTGPKYTDYQTTMTIFGLDEYNNRVVKFIYHNAFLTDLGDIQYNYRSDTEIESRFTFTFSQMEIELMENGLEL